MVEWTEIQMPTPKEELEYWSMYFHISLKIAGGGTGILFISTKGDVHKYVMQIMFLVLNNIVEYVAALHGLRITITLEIKRLPIRGDSALVMNQMNKNWSRTNEKMDAYCMEIGKL